MFLGKVAQNIAHSHCIRSHGNGKRLEGQYISSVEHRRTTSAGTARCCVITAQLRSRTLSDSASAPEPSECWRLGRRLVRCVDKSDDVMTVHFGRLFVSCVRVRLAVVLRTRSQPRESIFKFSSSQVEHPRAV
jgi:hypothetical protein